MAPISPVSGSDSDAPAVDAHVDLKVQPSVVAVSYDDVYLLVDQRGKQLHLLNEQATLIVRGLLQHSSWAALVRSLAAEYEISPDQARADTWQFLLELRDQQMLEIQLETVETTRQAGEGEDVDITSEATVARR